MNEFDVQYAAASGFDLGFEPHEEVAIDDLLAELDHWSSSGNNPRLFLRDDDTIEQSAGLTKLVELCERWQIPLLLAVIPKFAKR